MHASMVLRCVQLAYVDRGGQIRFGAPAGEAFPQGHVSGGVVFAMHLAGPVRRGPVERAADF